MSNPVVSIIIPTYNRTDYLKLTLESILNQTFRDFEIIVVDDGTPNDENMLLCQTFGKVNYIKIRNSGGPAKPRNVGILEAKGKYFAFVDDDDLWLSNKLEKQVAVLENNIDFGLVHCCCQVIDDNGIEKKEIIGRPGSWDVKHGDVSMRMMGNWTLMMPTPLIRRDIIDQVGLFNEKIPGTFADVEFWNRTSFYTQFYYIDEVLVHYRIHPQNMSNNRKIYLDLPISLKNVLNSMLKINRINDEKYNKLLNNLVKSQIKTIKLDYSVSLMQLFKLDKWCLFRYSNIKLLLFVLLRR